MFLWGLKVVGKVPLQKLPVTVLPNAKSDSINLDDSDTLATSKAVKNIADLSPVYKGSQYIGDISTPYSVRVNFPDIGTDNYIVLGSLLSMSTPILKGGYGITPVIRVSTFHLPLVRLNCKDLYSVTSL